MKSKLSMSYWFSREDEEFWSQVEDEQKRAVFKDQLSRMRGFSLLTVICIMIITCVSMFQEINIAALALFVIVPQLMIYLDVNSKIRIIKLYEIFSGNQRK
jgi:hypothetical protein